MTRLGDLLDFLKSLATITLPKSCTFLGNFCKCAKIYHFFSEIILGNFYRHLAIFSGHTEGDVQPDRHKSQTCLECSRHACTEYLFWVCHKHNSLQFRPIQPV